MNFFRFTLLMAIGFFMTACGGDEKSNTSTVAGATVTIKVDAGEDKYIKINETLEINAIEVPDSNNVSSYLWEYKANTLATTRSFYYTPTTLGVEVLNFSVTYMDGLIVRDTIKVIVTAKEINVSIPKISEQLKMQYLSALNNARTQEQDCGVQGIFAATTSLAWSDKLYKAAYEHSQDLIASKTFEHEGSGTESDWTGYRLNKKSNFIERIETYGYKWSRLGENLAGGTAIITAKDAVNSWLKSDNHCENLMNPNFTEVGMVMVKDDSSLYTHYWSQNFGTPKQ